MNRRQILEYTAWLTGAAVSAPLASALLTGCSEKVQQATVNTQASGAASSLPLLHFFAPEQFKLLAELADTILPRTDSPSATDVGAHTMIDAMFGQVFEGDYKSSYKSQWLALQDYLNQKGFGSLDTDARVSLLQTLELSEDSTLETAQRGLIETKQQLVAYYLNTGEVAKKFLNYLPIPGAYHPCISVQDVNNKAWAL
jgi:hypothetical protein